MKPEKPPDDMRSTAQDYRNDDGGDQQHIWQATLGQESILIDQEKS